MKNRIRELENIIALSHTSLEQSVCEVSNFPYPMPSYNQTPLSYGAYPVSESTVCLTPNTQSYSSMPTSLNASTYGLPTTQSGLNLPTEEYDQNETAGFFMSGYQLMDSMDCNSSTSHTTLQQIPPLIMDSHCDSQAACPPQTSRPTKMLPKKVSP